MNPAAFLRALDRSHHTPNAACPRCQEHLDRATGVVDDDAPKPGDVSVCMKCGSLLEYQADLSFRLMTDAEVAALPEPVLLSVLDATEGARIMRNAFDLNRCERLAAQLGRDDV